MIKNYYEPISPQNIVHEIDGRIYGFSTWQVSDGFVNVELRTKKAMLDLIYLPNGLPVVRIARTGESVKTLNIPDTSNVFMELSE